MRHIVLYLVLAVAACTSSAVPNGIISLEKMQGLVKDMVHTDEFINNYLVRDSSLDIRKKRSELYEKVFLLHKTTRKDFFNSFKYYQQRPDLQKALFDSLAVILTKDKDTIRQATIDTNKLKAQ